MDIVFNINQLGLTGLGATLTSLIRHCSNNKELTLWFLCTDLLPKDKSNITLLLTHEKFEGDAQFVDFDAKKTFGHLRALHGDWTTYGRLLIPTLISKDSALYLDSDLVILADVLELKNFPFSGNLLAAVYGCTIEWAFDQSFFVQKLNWTLDKAYFNAGIVLFNLAKWRAEETDKKWRALTDKYPNDLISHDQTLLNALSEGQFAYLPLKFNTPWFPDKDRPENSEAVILHFVGSPKPWDVFGNFIHKGYKTWRTYNLPFWNSAYNKITLDQLRRSWKIKGSLFLNFKKRFLKLAK
jgi:lipopolysaccharide biosynthesis glycosyltransferase